MKEIITADVPTVLQEKVLSTFVVILATVKENDVIDWKFIQQFCKSNTDLFKQMKKF